MAAYYGQSVSRASVGRSIGPELLLPNGPCNAKEQTGGPHASSCGCRRFWLREPIAGSNPASGRAWCFCGHHACFHDHVRNNGTSNNAGGHDQVTAMNAPTPTQHVAVPSNEAQEFVAPTWSELLRGASADARNVTTPARPPSGLGINGDSQPHSVNTRLWNALNGFARQQMDDMESGRLSKLPSTAPLPSIGAPGVVEDTRPSPSRDLQNRNSHFRSMGPPVTIPHAEMMANVAGPYSATEVATEVGTPSVQGTPDFRRHSPPNAAQATLSRQRGPPSEMSQPRRPSARPISAGPSLSIQEMCNTIQNFGQRIAQLESMSFDNIPSNEVRQRFEMQDGRLLDLELWRSDQEQARENDDTQRKLTSFEERLVDLEEWREHDQHDEDDLTEPSAHRKRALLPLSDSFESDGSFDLSAAQQTEAVVLATLAANAETRPRIEALESRIEELEQTASPSFARPWTIQVVLLPFGRQLPGIWFSSMESTQHSLRSGAPSSQEWSGNYADAKSSFRSAATSGAWTTESIEAWAKEAQDEWLSPKACGPSGAVFQRLASRGLVREVEIQAPDAGHIFNTISSVFGDILSTGGSTTATQASNYHALRERYIPLRKVRKSSRLRYLSQAEMVTPAMWSANFLESSVFMKVQGERRLYLTTPEGYLQPPRPSWSWQGLRQLPLYDGDGALQAAEALGKVIDACWSFTPRLDHVSSPQSSSASGDSPWSESVFKDFADIDAEVEVDLGSPVARMHDQRRSVSLPTSAPARRMEVDAASKRRVTSFEQDSAGSVQPTTEMSAKRRRISRSPEWERRGFGITPRYSPPQASVEMGPLRSSQGATSSRGRATTPFAMPTPRSHDDSRAEDRDLEIDGDFPMSHSDGADPEEEWEGMQDGPTISPVPGASRHRGIIDEDVDQDDLESLDAGETIYEVFDEI